MKKIFRSILIGCVVVSMLLTMASCGKQKDEIQNVIAEFEYSCNTLDVNAILNCINPSVADTIKIAVGIYGMFTNQNIDKILEGLSDTLIGDSSIDGTDFFSSIKIDVKDIKVDGENAVATTYVQYIIAGETFQKTADFHFIYSMEKWYVSSLKFT